MNRYESFRPDDISPETVNRLYDEGFITVNPLFNIAQPNHDEHPRYDLIHPESEERLLWVEHGDKETENLIEKVIGSPEHPVFFDVVQVDADGELRELPAGVRSLAVTLEAAPYIPEYMQRLEKRAHEFLGKLAIIGPNQLGFDIEDLVINHNGDSEDDVFFCLASPVEPLINRSFAMDPDKFARLKRMEIKNYIAGLKEDA